MAKKKRQHDAEPDNGDPDALNLTQKRLKRSDEHDYLAKIYNQLADEVQTVRIKAAGDLIRHVTAEPQEQNDRLDRVEQRLIRGLCSGRKAARLGFSIALAEIFRMKFSLPGSVGLLEASISKIDRLTTPEGKVSGQEQRDHLLGRRYAYQALLHSDVLVSKELDSSQWVFLIGSIMDLAGKKQWLRREVLGMLHDYLTSTSGQLDLERVGFILQAAALRKLLKTPEGVGLWITVQHQYADATLPSKIWRSDDPLSPENMEALAKALSETSDDGDISARQGGTRQSTPSFAWKVILSQLVRKTRKSVSKGEAQLATFWRVCVSEAMFSTKSSPERKALGLQIFSEAIGTLPARALGSVIDRNVLRCVQDQRAKPDNTLFEASKAALNHMVVRAKREPDAAVTLLRSIWVNGVDNFDQKTKTKTVESIIGAANDASLEEIVGFVRSRLSSPTKIEDSHMDTYHRSQADIFLVILRTHKDLEPSLIRDTSLSSFSGDYTWLENLLAVLSSAAYAGEQVIPVLHQRLVSILNILMVGSLSQVVKAPLFVLQNVKESIQLRQRLSPQAKEAVDKACSYIDQIHAGSLHNKNDEATGPSNDAFSLLFALSTLQVFNEDTDAVGVLQDLIMCYQSLDQSTDATTMLVELLLSFVSKQSALFRKLAEQVFTAVAAEMTEDSLQSLLDILEQKESLSGQQELFADNDQADGLDTDGLDDSDVAEIDVEDASDVEMINGEEVELSGSEGHSTSEDDDDSASEVRAGADDDEELAFDKKLAEALGTGRIDSDESQDDGSDMDDEQMMALEPHLTTIFKERQKKTSKKQEKKEAKENIVNFKNRVLDLLAIFVKSQYSSVLAMETILPLVRLVRTTTNKQTGEKAFAVLKQYFETCNKHKAFPQLSDGDEVFEVLKSTLDEMKQGGSKIHANACSRSALFLAKVLINSRKLWYERIAEQYAKLMSEWWLDPKTKIQSSVFTEWTSWSIGTRKQESGRE